ncbi:MAG: peptide ABC transporter substrate-binding protein [Chloroflexota bacterium]|nr:peptide ABC transporter substrate-binding protein [Chloroflexota bacterium]
MAPTKSQAAPPAVVLAATITPGPPEETTRTAATSATADVAASGAAGDARSPAGNVLRLNFFVEPTTLDPQQATNVSDIQLIMLNYLPLMTFDTALKLVPGAAAQVDISDEGQTLTFKLHPDQQFADGAPLTAAHFEYAWKRVCDPLIAAGYVSIAYPIIGCQEYAEAITTNSLTVTDVAALQELRDQVGVHALDDDTLEIKLKEQAPYFLYVTALFIGVPVREDLIARGDAAWWSDPATYVGNGPFQLTEWEHDHRVRFERNPHYVLSDRSPKLEAIEGLMIPETNVAFEAYLTDELDIIDLFGSLLPRVEADPQLQSQRVDTPGSCTYFLQFNTTAPPFDKKAVRQAFAQALDREGWARDIGKGLRTPALSFIPRGQPGHDPTERRYTFDPAAAKQKLAASGYDMSQPLKLTYFGSSSNEASHQYLAAMFQNVLGVKITLDPVEPSIFGSLFESPATLPQLTMGDWCADYPDPQNWLSVAFRTGGVVAATIGWSNPKFDELTAEADKLRIDDPRRAQLYQEAQRLLVEEAPVAFFVDTNMHRLVKPWVKGLNATPLDYVPGLFSLETLEIATD